MATLIQRVKRHLVLGIFLAIVCSTNMGCRLLPEATFQLASASRLPKWIRLPPGLTRANVSLTMNYYVKPWGRTAEFILRDKNEQIMRKEDGKMRCKEPFQLKHLEQSSSTGYPAYEAITVKGITEIIEHRKMEPIFYVTDDPAVWKQYESIGCD
ncbi:MAG TPA: hypothetical protein VFE38_01700 [Edaphobacter sp.]|nr:hypothetical protein [Edaphobacter sp.]